MATLADQSDSVYLWEAIGTTTRSLFSSLLPTHAIFTGRWRLARYTGKNRYNAEPAEDRQEDRVRVVHYILYI